MKGAALAPPFSCTTKYSSDVYSPRPPDIRVRLLPTKPPVHFTTEQPGRDSYDAAIAEKGTYDDGYTAGFAKGKTEGYEEGYAAGHEDGSSEGYDAGYDSGTSDAAQSAAEAEKNTRVWVSKRLGSRYHSSPDCPLVIKPKEMTRQEAEDEGYTSCDWCW